MKSAIIRAIYVSLESNCARFELNCRTPKLACGFTRMAAILQSVLPGAEKHREQNDAPQPRMVLLFNGQPIPRGGVIVVVPLHKYINGIVVCERIVSLYSEINCPSSSGRFLGNSA